MKVKKIIMLVFGTRPEAIKMAPLFHKLKENSDLFDTLVCVTAQHRKMLDQVLNIFNIIPDIDLNLMKDNQTLSELSSKIITSMGKVFEFYKPDLVLVHGDTTTATFTAISAFYNHIPIGHIEAGLRTNDIFSPFPEEFNRQVISKISTFNYAPTKSSSDNLIKEGINQNRIFITGNTVIDSLFWVLNKIEKNSEILNSTETLLNIKLNFNWKNTKFILITGHRRENFGDGFIQICKAILDLAIIYPNIHFVYPVHLNPNVINPVYETIGKQSNIHLIEPLDYEPFIFLMKFCYIILTDSGGIQEEAPSLGKPVLVMRNVTERPEAVISGTVKLVGANTDNIKSNIIELLENPHVYKKMSTAYNPYGNGTACNLIFEHLKNIYE
jgi:UDP-N-acetylglucosamine 2-epimerase (non-hydrolysing)